MKKLALKVLILVLPFAIGAIIVQNRLARFKTIYTVKRDHLEKALVTTELLIMGSSTAYFGIDPSVLRMPAFNLAYRAQSLYHDEKLLETYLARMPRLSRVWLIQAYLTLGTQQYDLPDHEVQRSLWYTKTYGIPIPPRRNERWWHRFDPARWCFLVNAPENPVSVFFHPEKDGLDGEAMTPLGWYDQVGIGGSPDPLVGASGAARANGLTRAVAFEENLQTVERMIRLLQSRKVEVTVIWLPVLPMYMKHVDPKYYGWKSRLKQVTERNHALYRDLTDDGRFGNSDFTFMPDHLNAQGARKVTEILGSDQRADH